MITRTEGEVRRSAVSTQKLSLMERQVSHRHASISSGGIHALAMKKPLKPLGHPLPDIACLQMALVSMSFPDLLKVAKQLRHAGVITSLRLFVSPSDRHVVNQRFSSLDHRMKDAVVEFTRTLSRAIEGWMRDVEIGLSPWDRDLKVLSDSLGFSKTLRRLSFANSELGDVRLEVLAGGLRDCTSLQTLDLSGCALTDASARYITVIVKSAITRKAELEWKASLRGSVSRRCGEDNYPIENLALAALDLSYNAFTDLLPRDLCVALRMGAPLSALNLRFNQMTRVGAKFLLDVMHEFNILRLVDLRGNEDEEQLGVLENGEHYTEFSTFQAPFWLESRSKCSNSEAHDKKKEKKRDSKVVGSKKPNLPITRPSSFKILTPSLSSPWSSPTTPLSLEPTQESSEGGIDRILTVQRLPPTQGRPRTAPARLTMPVLFNPEQNGSCDQENSRPISASNESYYSASVQVPSWDQDWVRKQSQTPPGMVDPPREAVPEEPPKMFTNELFEVEDQKSTPTTGVCSVTNMKKEFEKELGEISNFSSLRNTPRRSSAERANNKRKIPDNQKRRSFLVSRTSRKSPTPNQIAGTKYLTYGARNQKKTKPRLQNVTEEHSSDLMSSVDDTKDVGWHKFVVEMTETLLTIRDGLDRLIGPTEDGDALPFAQDGASKLSEVHSEWRVQGYNFFDKTFAAPALPNFPGDKPRQIIARLTDTI